MWPASNHVRGSTYPIDGVSAADASPGEGMVRRGLKFGMLPVSPSLFLDCCKVGQSFGGLTPPKVIEDEASHASGLSSVDYLKLAGNASGTYDANDSILAIQGQGERFCRVVHFYSVDVAGKLGRRL